MVGAGDNGSIPDGTGDVLGYHELLERVPAIVYVADPGESGRWYYASPRIEEILGYTPEAWCADPEL